MPKSLARVCQIGTTNYVDYKGERLTVREHNKKYGTKIKVPKDVKVCESEDIYAKTTVSKHGTITNKGNWHGSKAKKERTNKEKWRRLDCPFCVYEETCAQHDPMYNIDIPKNLRRVGPVAVNNFVDDPRRYSNMELAVVSLIAFVVFASLIIHSLK
jgi:hypothetical protein